MLFNSFEFILMFLPAVLLGSFFLKNKAKALVSFLAFLSVIFYGIWIPKYIALLLGSVAVNFNLAKKASGNKNALWLAVTLNALLLGFFKYAGFFTRIANDAGLDMPVFKIALPLAISFFTFQQIAFVVDSYKGNVKPDSFINYLFFVSFFPQLIAGPIVNYKTIFPQIPKIKILDKELTIYGLQYFILGLFKKTVIADSLSSNAAQIYDGNEALTAVSSWIGTLSYTIQLYFDFSGYTDMAIGLALLFGIALPINFDSPYKSKSIQEFWRRWHITLSAWFKEYVYIPLGGNKKGFSRTLLNIFLIALISGLWHGAGYGFIVWGTLHGIALVAHRIWKENIGITLNPVIAFFVTFTFVHFSWIFFRAPSLESASNVFTALFFGSSSVFGALELTKSLFILALLVCCLVLPSSNVICRRVYPTWVSFVTGAILFLSIGFMSRVKEFVYFQF